jgi:hypothetical protein
VALTRRISPHYVGLIEDLRIEGFPIAVRTEGATEKPISGSTGTPLPKSSR